MRLNNISYNMRLESNVLRRRTDSRNIDGYGDRKTFCFANLGVTSRYIIDYNYNDKQSYVTPKSYG